MNTTFPFNLQSGQVLDLRFQDTNTIRLTHDLFLILSHENLVHNSRGSCFHPFGELNYKSKCRSLNIVILTELTHDSFDVTQIAVHMVQQSR